MSCPMSKPSPTGFPVLEAYLDSDWMNDSAAAAFTVSVPETLTHTEPNSSE